MVMTAMVPWFTVTRPRNRMSINKKSHQKLPRNSIGYLFSPNVIPPADLPGVFYSNGKKLMN
jgi:hypothetical protein